jgi:hypothetical protein
VLTGGAWAICAYGNMNHQITASLPQATVGQPYRAVLTAAPNSWFPPFGWRSSRPLPPGLEFALIPGQDDAYQITITGTPQSPTTTELSLGAANSYDSNSTSLQPFSLVIVPGAPADE